MRKNNIFSIACFLIVILANNVYSQCGIHPKFDVEQNGGVTVAFNTSQTVLDPNWKITKYKWLVNDVAKDSGAFLTPTPYAYFLPTGYSKVDLILWGTDTTTNDSCSAQYGNIFHSTGSTLYPEMTVSCTGLDANINTHFWGDAMANVNVTVDWGDGTMPVQGVIGAFSHTYPTSGDYVVNVTMSDQYGNLATDSRKVHINNGMDNYILSGMISNTGCTSVVGGTMNIYPFTTLTGNSFELMSSAQGVAFGNFAMGSPFYVPVAGLVPGQYMLRTLVTESNSIFPIIQFSSITKSVCGIQMDTIHGIVFSDLDADGIQDTNEVGVPNMTIGISGNSVNANYSAKTDSIGMFSLVIPRALVYVQVQYNSNLYYNLESKEC